MSEERLKKTADEYYKYWTEKAYKTLELHDKLYGTTYTVPIKPKKKWWQVWK